MIIKYSIVLTLIMVLVVISNMTGCGSSGDGAAAPITQANIIYVSDSVPSADSTAFKTFLEAAGYTVTIVFVDDIGSTDFSTADLIIVKTSTLSQSDWNSVFFAAHATALYATQKPILSIYLGNHLFGSDAFNLFIDYGQAMEILSTTSVNVDNASAQFWSIPNSITVTTGADLAIYTDGQINQSIFWEFPPATAHKLVVTPGWPNHTLLCYQLVNSTRYFHWGSEGRPTDMTTDGQNLFLNVVYWMVNG